MNLGNTNHIIKNVYLRSYFRSVNYSIMSHSYNNRARYIVISNRIHSRKFYICNRRVYSINELTTCWYNWF